MKNGHKRRAIRQAAALLLSMALALSTIPSSVFAVSSVSGVSSDSSESSSESSSENSSESNPEISGSSEGSSTSTESGSSESSSDSSSDSSEAGDAVSGSEVEPDFTVNSGAVYLVNMDSGIAIYQKNADQLMYPASLVKIMTCLLAIENCSDLAGTTVTASYTVFDNLWGKNASNAGLYPGENIRMVDLLYALMLRSGCDAAGVIAEYIGGSEEAFVEMMNAKAAEIGCTSTHFTNSTGLHDDNQYTTAQDIYRITAYAMQYDVFEKIATSYSYTMPATNKNDERTITHTCSIMNPSSSYYDETVHAIKTGTTDESGRNLVSYASKDAYNYMLVTMGAPIYYSDGSEIEQNLCYMDTLNLYDWAFNDWAVQTIVKTTDVKGQVIVDLCSTKDRVNAVPEEDVNRLMLKLIDSSALQMVADLPERIDAPVQKGQVLGTLDIRMSNQSIATVNLVASETLHKSAWLTFLRGLKNFFTSAGFWLTVLALIIGFTAWLFIIRQINLNKRKRRRAARKAAGKGSYPSKTTLGSKGSRTGTRSSRSYSSTSGSQIRKAPGYKGPSSANTRRPQNQNNHRKK